MSDNERRLLDEVLARASGCPEADVLEAYDSGELDSAAREALQEHLASCEACGAALRFLEDEPEDREIPAVVVRRSDRAIAGVRETRSTFPRWGWVALAAAAATVLFFYVPTGEHSGTPPPQLRETGTETVRSLVAGPLSRADCRLRWSPGPDGSVYTVTLFTEDLRTLATAEGLTAAEYVVGESVLEELEGDTLVWRVEVFPPNAERRLSETFVSTLEP